jgi:hypothetical protein
MMPEVLLRCVILCVEPEDQNVYLESKYEKHRSACSFGHSKLHLFDQSQLLFPSILFLARSLALATSCIAERWSGMLRRHRCLC